MYMYENRPCSDWLEKLAILSHFSVGMYISASVKAGDTYQKSTGWQDDMMYENRLCSDWLEKLAILSQFSVGIYISASVKAGDTYQKSTRWQDDMTSFIDRMDNKTSSLPGKKGD